MEERQATISVEQIYDQRIEIVFYLTLLITIVHAGFILWDLVTLTHPGMALFHLQRPNNIVATGYMSTLYLVFLGIYAGYKEFHKWAKPPKIAAGAVQPVVPEIRTSGFKRGEAIVVFWVLLSILAIVMLQIHVIRRFPNELFRTTLQAVGVLFGTYASKSLRRKKHASSKSR